MAIIFVVFIRFSKSLKCAAHKTLCFRLKEMEAGQFLMRDAIDAGEILAFYQKTNLTDKTGHFPSGASGV